MSPKVGSLFKTVFTAIREGTVESAEGVRSPDQPTRRMAWLFLLSLLGLLVTLVFVGDYIYRRHQAEQARQARIAQLEAEKKDREEEARRRLRPPTYFSLGPFSLELRERSGVVKPRNATGTAEMEIVVACDEESVCDYVKAHLDAARGELSPLFVPTEREKLLTIPGKKAFREEIRSQLNLWLQKRQVTEGQVIEVLLPKFILS